MLSQKSVNGSQKLEMSAQKLASDLRQMQSYVLNLQDHNGSFPDGGWGVYFSSTSNNDRYLLFADDATNANNKFYYKNPELAQTIMLPGGIVISDIEVDDVSQAKASVDYVPPDPRVHLCVNSNAACTAGTAANKIEIILSNGTTDKTVEINKYGLIDVQD